MASLSLPAILPSILSRHNLSYRLEDRQSASILIAQNKLSPQDFFEQYPEIERTLLEAFVEDDFDGRLHLMTLKTTGEQREVVGLAFWREVGDREMGEWLDLHRVEETLKRHADDEVQQEHSPQPQQSQQQPRNKLSFKYKSDNLFSHHGRRRMETIQRDSITWIRNALNAQPDPVPVRQNRSIDKHQSEKQQTKMTISMKHRLIHAWIKIELIAIRKSHRSHHLGEILLACVLSVAHSHHSTSATNLVNTTKKSEEVHEQAAHAILHIAGSTQNTPAMKLYERFGFVALPKHEEGGPFDKPDGDLWILGDIGGSLETGPWEEIWTD